MTGSSASAPGPIADATALSAEGWEDPSAKVVGGVDDPVKNCCGWEEIKLEAYIEYIIMTVCL